MKICSKCGLEKDESEFSKHKAYTDGLRCWCKICTSEESQQYKKQNPEVGLRNTLKKKYGITLEEYNQMFAAQNGCCAGCGRHQSEFTKRLFVDHNHKTGEVRGLLCCGCNHSIGLLHDDPDTFDKLAVYLRGQETN